MALCDSQVPVPLKNVTVNSSFWNQMQRKNRTQILPAIYDVYEKTGRIESFRHDWKEGAWYTPHIFWDSDVAKWMETAAYLLGEKYDSETEEKLEHLIDLMEKNQAPSGYFNSYFQTVAPEDKWTNIHLHELYCIGHLIEAAVAYYNATGKNRFLKIMEKSIDHIYDVFVEKQSAAFRYPGHEEIELALIKLYRTTGNKKHLHLAKHFLFERGRQHQNQDNDNYRDREIQQHLPVEEQYEATGHAVRAVYLYSAMADLALETTNQKLWDTVLALWEDITERKMYVTGGVGTSFVTEAFTYSYDLPNEYGYTETCASIGLIFFAARMMRKSLDSKYGDVLERALYNTVLGGVSSDGASFFYSNPLAVDPKLDHYLKILKKHEMTSRERIIPAISRRKDLGCMCCPGNVSRIFASIGEYIASESDCDIAVHMPIGCELKIKEGILSIRSDYPKKSDFTLQFSLQKSLNRTFYFRIPAWCRIENVTCNGQEVPFEKQLSRGYIVFEPGIEDGTEITIQTRMDVQLVRAHSSVKESVGKVAVQKGPIVYCLEEADNGPQLANAYIDKQTDFEAVQNSNLSVDIPVLKCMGKAIEQSSNSLYFTEDFTYVDRTLTFVPFYTRLNRGTGEMIVWVNEYRRS